MPDITYDYKTYSEGLRRVFKAHSDEIAISCLLKNHNLWKISYGMILRYIEDFKIMRDRLGLKDGDRVLVLADTTVDAFLTFLVLSVNHLTPVMADAAIPDEELLPLIDYCQISAVYADKRNSEKMIKTQHVPVMLTYGLKSCGNIVSEGERLIDSKPSPDSVAILFSSGTTASRKCVELSYASIMITHQKVKDKGVLEIPHDRPMLEVFPMSHVSGLFSAYTLLYEGMSIATLELLSADTLTEGMTVFKPCSFGMVPKVHDMFINKFEEVLREKHLYGFYSFLASRSEKAVARTGNLRSSARIMTLFRSLLYNKRLSCIFSGGAASTPHTGKALQNLGIAYLDLFASTECGVFISCTRPGDPHIANGSVGCVKDDPYTEVIIHNPDESGVGEIYVKTMQIMNGYFRDEEETANSFDGEYFKTGDLGRIDEDGYLYVTGRIKESIVMPNGAKVAPVDMERLLVPCIPKDVKYAISGVPSPEDGADRIHLFIEKGKLSDTEQIDLRDAVLQFQYKAMNQYKISGIHFIDEIPCTNIGKPKRYLLKEYVLNHKDEEETKPEEAVEQITEVEVIPSSDPGKLSREEVEKKVFAIVKNISKYERDLTGLEDFKDDLGMDSLSLMEMSVEIESEFAVSVGAYISVIPNPHELIDYIIDPIFASIGASKKNPTKKVNAYLYPLKRKSIHRFLFSYFKRWSRKKLDIRVEGLENVKPGRQYVFCPNHQTHFDGLFVWTALGDKCPDIDRFGCMSKAEHLDNAITSLMMRTLGGIPVERSGNTIDSTQRSIDFVKEGNYFLIHPEGTRTRTGVLGPFKSGGAKIASETGLTIIPVAIKGGYEIWPYNRLLPDTYDKKNKHKRVLKITFCPEFQTIGRTNDDITAEVRSKIVEALED